MSTPRSLTATVEGIAQANTVLIAKKLTQEKLASNLGITKQPVVKFFTRRPVKRQIFVEICEKLELNWQEVCGQAIAQKQVSSDSTQPQLGTDLFQQIREHCRQKILNQHSRMRLLSGEEIGVDQLYVDVWLLNRSPRTFQVSESKLLETFDLRNDRLGLGDRIKRNPGFEVANDHSKLVILGKPGAGKTTFLKHLAMDWCKSEFQSDLIAVLLELRRIRDNQWNLIEAIDQELGLGNWCEFKGLKEQIENLKQKQIEGLQQQLEKLPLQSVLKHGRLLVLMDGLDEVPTNQLRRTVQDQIKKLAEDYPHNRLALTCRTQIMGTIPDGFTSVEIADFNEEQVQQFVMNWFTASGKTDEAAARTWETLDDAVNCNPALKELTVTPVLLSLMCLVLHDEGEIPAQRDSLYKRGIKLLLNKWNDAKQIDGWTIGGEAYEQLEIEQKEALLTEIAARKFENPNNFVLFQQDEIAALITQFLRLDRAREGVAILKAIEAQHGLLIERADELWSFSHLTFQEHFTVQWLTQLPADQLAAKIDSRQWQEVVKQIVKSQQPADRLVRLIKQAIDQSVASDSTIQEFLAWILQKAEFIQATHNPIAIRAFYFVLDRDLALNHTLALSCDLDHTREPDLALNRICNLPRAIPRDLALVFDLDTARAQTLALDLNLARALTHARARVLNHDLIRDLSFDLSFDSDLELARKLEQLRVVLPKYSVENWRSFQQWWQIQGTQWFEQLRQVIIEHRNIGHDWQFTEVQTQQLQRYYNANKFLIELIQIKGAVSNSVRTELEDRLLLPWKSL